MQSEGGAPIVAIAAGAGGGVAVIVIGKSHNKKIALKSLKIQQ